MEHGRRGMLAARSRSELRVTRCVHENDRRFLSPSFSRQCDIDREPEEEPVPAECTRPGAAAVGVKVICRCRMG